MLTNEQIEAWTDEAADALAGKIGPNACVIVMAMDVDGTTPWATEWRGAPACVIFLRETGNKVLDGILFKGTSG